MTDEEGETMLKSLSRRRSFPSIKKLFKEEEEGRKETKEEEEEEDRGGVPKGYVPVMVGNKDNERAKFLIHVKMFKKAYFVELLEMAADEFGYEHQGVLQIPCDALSFIRMLKHSSSL